MLSDQIKSLLDRIDSIKTVIDTHRPLPPSILQRLQEQISLEWTYNSNAIEGNTLSLKETQLVIQEGITVKNKPLREHLEAINHQHAINFIEDLSAQKSKITERNIREIHSLVLKEIDTQYSGVYRDINVRITGSKHTPPDFYNLSTLMKNFSKSYLNTNNHPVVEAAQAHFKLVSTHPFVDGNGRTARLLMNLILIKNGYVPTIILKNDRLKYYKNLEKSHSGNLNDFIFFIGRSLERSLYLYLEAIPDIKTNFITLKEASKLSTYSTDYLNILARRGSIPAFKLKRNWVVSKSAFLNYVKSKKRKQ